jgi:hypothetical protein
MIPPVVSGYNTGCAGTIEPRGLDGRPCDRCCSSGPPQSDTATRPWADVARRQSMPTRCPLVGCRRLHPVTPSSRGAARRGLPGTSDTQDRHAVAGPRPRGRELALKDRQVRPSVRTSQPCGSATRNAHRLTAAEFYSAAVQYPHRREAAGHGRVQDLGAQRCRELPSVFLPATVLTGRAASISAGHEPIGVNDARRGIPAAAYTRRGTCEGAPPAKHAGQRPFSTGWQVQDSNLRRHTPTDLQDFARQRPTSQFFRIVGNFRPISSRLNAEPDLKRAVGAPSCHAGGDRMWCRACRQLFHSAG